MRISFNLINIVNNDLDKFNTLGSNKHYMLIIYILLYNSIIFFRCF